ncbi:MAG: efflux RND transporter permease subunit [Stappiaceae bacterium]
MISHYFIDRPKFALVIAIFTSLVGAIAILLLPIAQFPDIAPPQVYVTTTYPGANASLIQDAVATPIEEQVNGVENMIYMSSTSSNEGNYSLAITFAVGTDPDIAAINVQNRVALATPILPAAVTQQGISTSKQSGDMIQVVNLVSPNGTYDSLFLSNYAANYLQDPLARIDGVGAVNQFGPLSYSMRVWIDPEKMAALNLTSTDVATAIENQNVEAASGTVGAPPFGSETTDFQFTLEADGVLKSAEEFEKIIVLANTDGSLVRLRDIARIELGSESYSSSARFNGSPSAVVAIYQESGANALDVADAVYSEMETVARQFPEDIEYRLTYDVTKAVRASLEEIAVTLGITAALVIGVTFLFLLSWRATIVPAIAIPVSLLGTCALIYLAGFSANMITLFAIVLAITLVVDDAIVIIENAERIMDEHGLEPREATLKAMSEVTRPIIATTFVLAAVFIPVCFFPGITGEIYLEFALTIIFAFALSAVNALTLGPVLCSLLLSRGTGKPKGIMRFIPAGLDKIRNGYVKLVGILLRHMVVSLVVFACVVAGTVYLFRTIPTGFIPPEDNGVLLSAISLPDGASLQRTKVVMGELSKMVEETPGVADAISVSGFSIFGGGQSNVGMVVIVLEPWEDRTTTETQWYSIMRTLDKKFATVAAAESFVFPLPPIHGVGSTGGISAKLLDIAGGSATDLDATKNALISALKSAPEFASAHSEYSAASPQYHLSIDRDRAETLGVNVGDIFTALQANLGSLYINNFVKDGRVYWVVVSAEAAFRQSLEDIENIYVKNASGDVFPLRGLISRNPIVGPDTIARFNLSPSASISGQLANGVSSGDGIAAMKKIAEKTLPNGYRVAWDGVTLQEVEAGGLVGYILLLAVVFAYLCLVAQYESWTLPMAVMASTIFAVCGALLPMTFVPFLDNNIYAQIGIVLLIGLAAKKAIMVVEFAKVAREQGASIHDAALSAARIRFRPVTMTGLCFIVGVLPLVMASGAGAAGRVSIGIPVFAGMILDSTLGLLMIPVLYAAFQTYRERVRNRFFSDRRPVTE